MSHKIQTQKTQCPLGSIYFLQSYLKKKSFIGTQITKTQLAFYRTTVLTTDHRAVTGDPGTDRSPPPLSIHVLLLYDRLGHRAFKDIHYTVVQK